MDSTKINKKSTRAATRRSRRSKNGEHRTSQTNSSRRNRPISAASKTRPKSTSAPSPVAQLPLPPPTPNSTLPTPLLQPPPAPSIHVDPPSRLTSPPPQLPPTPPSSPVLMVRPHAEFIPNSYRQDLPYQAGQRSLSIVIRLQDASWYLTVTVDKCPDTAKGVPLLQQKKDLEALCRCIDFGHIPMIANTATEVCLSYRDKPLPLHSVKLDPANIYASNLETLFFWIREDTYLSRYPRLSPYCQTIDVGNITKERKFQDGVWLVRVPGEQRPLVYKELDKEQFEPERDTQILEQELRYLERVPESKEVVKLVGVVSSVNPHRNTDADTTRVLRGFLLEYHSGGTMEGMLENTAGHRPWCRWAIQIAQGLCHIHSHGVAHLALKPSKVVISAGHSAVLIDISGGSYTHHWLMGPGGLPEAPLGSREFEERVELDVMAYGRLLSRMSEASTDSEEKRLLKDMGTLASAADRIPVQLGRVISLLQCLGPD